MTRPAKLTAVEIQDRLATIPGWTLREGRLRRELRFRDFSEAFAWIARAALAAERLGHHPDWSNSWALVTVELTTHDAGGLTELDFRLAKELDALSKS